MKTKGKSVDWASIPGCDWEWREDSQICGVHTHEGKLVWWTRPDHPNGYRLEVGAEQSFDAYLTSGPRVTAPPAILAELNQFIFQFVSGFLIRRITPEDSFAFHACLDAVARERKYLGLTVAPPIEATRAWLEESQKRGDIRLVALDGDQIVGWIDIETFGREGFKHSGRLGMGVLKAYRRQGLGANLLEQALAAARALGLERIDLDVYASNTPAIRLYEKYHFQIEGRKRNARKLDGQYDDLIMMAVLLDV